MNKAKVSARHDGNLSILTVEDARQYSHIEEVTGDLSGYATFNAPALASVGGSLYVYADFETPMLTSVVGNLYVYADFEAPGLASVGGYLEVYADFEAPALAYAYGKQGRLIATSSYGLWLADDGMYYAGCRGPFTRPQALAHWDRPDDRARIFTAAIKAAA